MTTATHESASTTADAAANVPQPESRPLVSSTTSAGLGPWLRLLLGMGGSAIIVACLLAMLVVVSATPPAAEQGDDGAMTPSVHAGSSNGVR